MISDDAFGKACHIVLTDYLYNEVEEDSHPYAIPK